MNKTSMYRFSLRLLLIMVVLSLVGCTVYSQPRYSDRGLYYDDPVYYSSAPSVYAAFPVHYPYWSLDYFYFSQYYHPYSVFVGYYEPFYHPYPGWYYGYRPYRPGLSVSLGFSSYPWYWHGHYYRPSHYGWFGSGYYGYGRGYRHGYRDGRYDDRHDHNYNRAHRVSARMREVRARDIAYSRAGLLSRNGRTGAGGTFRAGNDDRSTSVSQRQRLQSGANRNSNAASRISQRSARAAAVRSSNRDRGAANRSAASGSSSRQQVRARPATPNLPNRAQRQRSSNIQQQGLPTDRLRGRRVVSQTPPVLSRSSRAQRNSNRYDVRSRSQMRNETINGTRQPDRPASRRVTQGSAPVIRSRPNPQSTRMPREVNRSSQRSNVRAQRPVQRTQAARQQAQAPRRSVPVRSGRPQNTASPRQSQSRPSRSERPSRGERNRVRDQDGA